MIDAKTLQKIRNYFSKQTDIVAVYLYGSQVNGEDNALSDVDVSVLLDKKAKNKFRKQLKFIGDLQNFIGKKDADVKLLDDDYSLNYLHQVLSEGKLIYCRNKSEAVFFKTKINDLYFDFQPFLLDYYQAMNQRIDKGEYAS